MRRIDKAAAPSYGWDYPLPIFIPRLDCALEKAGHGLLLLFWPVLLTNPQCISMGGKAGQWISMTNGIPFLLIVALKFEQLYSKKRKRLCLVSGGLCRLHQGTPMNCLKNILPATWNSTRNSPKEIPILKTAQVNLQGSFHPNTVW